VNLESTGVPAASATSGAIPRQTSVRTAAEPTRPTVGGAAVKLTRLGYLDALRGFAVLGVILVHASQQAPGPVGQVASTQQFPDLPGAVATLAAQGRHGVQLFFVVSALTLTLSARARFGRESHPTLDFFVRRFFRIAPMFWLGTLFYAWLYGFAPRFWAPEGTTPVMVASTFAFLHGFTPGTIDSVVPGGWSIAVETTFYVALPLLLLLLTSLTRALWAVCLSVAASVLLGIVATGLLAPYFPGADSYLVQNFTVLWFPAQLPVFCIGIALAFLVGRPVEDARARSALAVLGGLAAMVALAFGAYTYLTPDVLYALAFAALVWGLSIVPWRILVNPVTRYLGAVSFSAYLVQFWVLDEIRPWIVSTGTRGTLRFGLTFAVATVLTIAAASVTYRLVEKPGMALGKRVVERIERSRAPSIAAKSPA
jgi:peptidoglycan/LPS O-acetylase OafA/YrhL